jgi:hypothetical protein
MRVAGAVDRDAAAGAGRHGPQVNQHRIDHQRKASVVFRQREAGALISQ